MSVDVFERRQIQFCVRVNGRQALYHADPLIEALHEQIREHWRRYRRQRRTVRKFKPYSTERMAWQTAAEDTEDTLHALFTIRRAGRVR